MNQTIIVILLVAIAIAVALVAFFSFRHYRDKQARHIREHFGPEYSRLAEEKGRVAAEKELAVREKRAAKFEIRSHGEWIATGTLAE